MCFNNVLHPLLHTEILVIRLAAVTLYKQSKVYPVYTTTNLHEATTSNPSNTLTTATKGHSWSSTHVLL